MASDISQSSLNLSPEEIRVYSQLFQQADTESLGVVTGDVAVKFFERTRLDATVLGEIWQLADSENRGLLTPAGFSVALRLIGHCQAGRTPSIELASRPGPLPRFTGSNIPSQAQRPATPTQPLNPQSTGGSFVNAQTSGQPVRVPPLPSEKVVEYQSIFEKAGARNGILGGEAAKQMFEKAKLPNEVLSKIWNLADVEQRGALNQTEFIIAMHLLTSMRTGTLRTLPQNLPAGLYEAASRRPVLQGPTVASIGAVPRQFTGQSHQRTASPLSRPFGTPEIAPQSTGNDWLVSPHDKAKFDQIFATVDKTGLGYINGDQAVQFFSNSGLSEDTLASIWDLADVRSEGQLNKEEFAVAMYLIRQQRAKKDDRDNLPSTLPPKLIPPSMRQRFIPPSQPTAPAFDNAAFASFQQPKSASEDLFGLDALASEDKPAQQISVPISPSPQAQAAHSFQNVQPQQSISPQTTSSTAFKPFMPSSAFGQGIAAQSTGLRSEFPATQAIGLRSEAPAAQNTGFRNELPTVPSREFQRLPPSGADDLLGDNDPEISQRLTEETTEFANMSNQINTLRTQTKEVENKKITAENNLSATSNQKRELEGRLAQIRTHYEQEVRQVKSLEERLNTSRNETRKMQQELAMLEGTYQDLQNQNRQTATALEADQRENAALKERMRQMNAEVAALRPHVDKMRSDVRQQKGLVAINKKQLATSEAERDKLHSDISDSKREHEESLREHGELMKALEAAQQDTAQLRMRAQQEHAQRESERENARLREAAQREALQREKAQYEAEQREAAQREEAHRDAERHAAEQRQRDEAVQREATQRQSAEREAAQREVLPQESKSSVVSPAASAFSQSTNPFSRKSPQPPLDSVLSPSIFTQEFGSTTDPNDFDNFFGPAEQRGTDLSFSSPPDDREHGRVVEGTTAPSSADGSSPVTPFTRSLEPPAPPQSRQITSSFLPFKSELVRSESFSSSVRANPPASRAGMSATDTPTQAPSSPDASVNGDIGSNMGDSQNRSLDTSMERTRHSTVSDASRPAEEEPINPHTSPAIKSHARAVALSPKTADEVPGAFPESPAASTPSRGSFASERVHDEAPNASNSTLDDPFATKEDHLRPASPSQDDKITVPDDSRSSLHGFSTQTAPSSATTSHIDSSSTQRAHTEFPPIREIDNGDDSDSNSDDELDKNFSAMPASKDESTALPHSGSSNIPENTVSSTNERPGTNQSVLEVESTTDSQPPTPNAQKSPPTYDQAVPQSSGTENRDSNAFPREYGGLLPSREIVSSPPIEVPQSPPQSLTASASKSEVPSGVNSGPYQPQYSTGRSSQPTFSAGPPSFLTDGTFYPPWLARKPDEFTPKTGLPLGSFGGSSHQQQNSTSEGTEAVPASSADDFDDEFADLDEAREADDLGQDDFVIRSARKGGSEFDPAFEKPLPINSSALNFQGGSSATQPSQGGPSPSRFSDFITSFKGSGTSPLAQENFPSTKQEGSGDFDFGFQSSSSSPLTKQTSIPGAYSGFNPASTVSGSYQPSPTLAKATAPSSSHDWDSIFAGLDNNASSSTVQSNGAAKDPFALDDQTEPTPTRQPPQQQQQQQNYQPPTVEDYNTPALPQRQPQQQQQQQDVPHSPPPPTQKQRPVPGRALSTGTEHDDPILKNLTGMGFKREDALKTLERFDYNIDKAVDYLSKRR